MDISVAMTETPSGDSALAADGRLAYARPMAAADDTELMQRYADGDAGAFEPLYRRHNDAVFRYLVRLSGNPATAEELAQEAWTKLIDARRRYQASAQFRTYLFRIAHNAFIDRVRRHRHREETLLAEPAADPDKQPERISDDAALRQRLQAALLALPIEQRDAWLLHEEAGLSIDAVASATGVNRETAKSRIRYAVRKLKDRLAAELAPGDL
ncbi:MAG: sigma-70 family RNA polymerase sigma factor [Pseudomonadota bacterium]